MQTDATISQPSLTVYFDGACPVCSREVAAYQRQVGAEACAWIDASTCERSALGDDLTREAALGRFHVRRADGRLIHGARGFAALWLTLPRLAWMGRVASTGPVALLLDAAYAIVLKVRPLWQKAPTRTTSWIEARDDRRARPARQIEAPRDRRR